MKLSRLFCALGVCAVSLTSVSVLAADAESELGWYMGGNVGRSHIKLRTQNIGVLNGDQDTNDTGYKIYGGYRFHKNWAAEVQYYDLGKYKYTEPKGTIDVKTHGIAISALGLMPVSKVATLFAKLGLGHQRFAGTATTATAITSESTSKAVPLIGVGVDYKLSTNWSMRAEYEYFGVPTVLSGGNQAIKFRTDLLSVGVRYQF